MILSPEYLNLTSRLSVDIISSQEPSCLRYALNYDQHNFSSLGDFRFEFSNFLAKLFHLVPLSDSLFFIFILSQTSFITNEQYPYQGSMTQSHYFLTTIPGCTHMFILSSLIYSLGVSLFVSATMCQIVPSDLCFVLGFKSIIPESYLALFALSCDS